MPVTLMAGLRPLVAKTCTTCGELKDAREYYRNAGGWYQSSCKACAGHLALTETKRINHESWDRAYKRYSRWTKAEIDKMWRLTDQGLKAKEIAALLERSVTSIYVVRNKYPRSNDASNRP